jgi:hypothetical protein
MARRDKKTSARQEDIDSAVGSYLRADGPRAYRNAYDDAKRMKEAGTHPGEIRGTLRRTPHKEEYSAADSARCADQKKIHNTVEQNLCDAARTGVEDALADRPANYHPPLGHR